MTSYIKLPDEITGYALDQDESFWQICVPEATTNLLHDPSFEDPAWIPVSTLAPVYGVQSVWSNSNIVQTFVAEESGTHTFSAFIRWNSPSDAGNISLSILNTVPAVIATKPFYVEGMNWVRAEIQFKAVAGSSYTAKVVTSTGLFFITDCWQVEAKAYATTYADGDMGILYPYAENEYYWTGERLQSTSKRTILTRSGGRFMSLRDYGFRTTIIDGSGIVKNDHVFTESAKNRFRHNKSAPKQRELTIGGRIFGCDLEKLLAFRRGMGDLLQPFNHNRDEPLLLRIYLHDNYVPTELLAYYVDGMEGSLTNLYQYTLSMRFICEDSHFYGVANSEILSMPNTLADDCAALARNSETGEWVIWQHDEVGTGAIYGMDYDENRRVYVAGDIDDVVHELFTAAEMEDLGYSGSAIGTGLGGQAEAIAVAKDGSGYIGLVGKLTYLVGGVPTATNTLWWNGATWAPMGQDVNNNAYTVYWDNGLFYVGGDFTEVTDGDGTPHGFNELTDQYSLLCTYDPAGDQWVAPVTNAYDLTSVWYFHPEERPRVWDLVAGLDDRITFAGYFNTGVNPQGTQRNVGWLDTDYYAYRDVQPYAQFRNLTNDNYPYAYSVAVNRANTYALARDVNDVQYIAMSQSARWTQRTLVTPATSDQPQVRIDKFGNFFIAGPVTSIDGYSYETWAPFNRLFDSPNMPTVPIDLLSSVRASTSMIARMCRVDDWMYFTNRHLLASIVGLVHNVPVEDHAVNCMCYLIGPVKLHAIYNWTNKSAIYMQVPLNVALGQVAVIYNLYGTLRYKLLGARNAVVRTLNIHPVGSDASTLVLSLGDNAITAFYEGEGTVYLNWRNQRDTL